MSTSVIGHILANNQAREGKILSQFACPNSRGIRRHPEWEKVPDQENIRPVFFHDSDKIMHSKAYTRYQDKTQVFSLFENDHITHRALHVQFVSRIGRVIGRCLQLNEDLIEAIALGHDIGHTPFGHDGESVLNQICLEQGIGCFAHNAQSVRFLMEVENNGQGLNLSLQVLDGILCHNGEILQKEYRPAYEKSWEQFDEEYEKCFQQLDYSKKLFPMTLEGCVMRISDVIAYIGRDVEDAIRVNLIKRSDMPVAATSVLGDANDRIINTLVMDLIENSYGKDALSFSDGVYAALKELMAFNYRQIYTNPLIKTEKHKIDNMFRTLFQAYCGQLEAISGSQVQLDAYLADFSADYLENTDHKRVIVDFMAGMTDDFLTNQYKQLFVPRNYGYAIPTG